MMEPNPVFKGTLVLDICSKGKKIREALWMQDGQEPQSLSIYHHLGMFVDTVLIGPLTVDCIDVRFYNYPCSIQFYDCNVEHVHLINHLPYALSVSGLTETILLQPGDSITLENPCK